MGKWIFEFAACFCTTENGFAQPVHFRASATRHSSDRRKRYRKQSTGSTSGELLCDSGQDSGYFPKRLKNREFMDFLADPGSTKFLIHYP